MMHFFQKITNIIYFKFIFLFKDNFSNLVLVTDGAKWILDKQTLMLKNFLKKKLLFNNKIYHSTCSTYKQFVYLQDQYQILKKYFFNNKNIVALDYLHGFLKFNKNNKKLLIFVRNNQKYIKIIRVTNSFFKNYLISNGIKKSKIITIPIPVDINFFKIKKKLITYFKTKYSIPRDKFIVGSFQKDGIGWGMGDVAKLIKGPDILIKILITIKKKIPNLHVLLTGPARGYLVSKLKKNKISFSYLGSIGEFEMPYAYASSDLYLVSSRDEGGPMGIFESMAVGTPVVSTKVGHAHDHIKNYYNGFAAKINAVSDLSAFVYKIYNNEKLRKKIIKNGKLTAKNNTINKQKKKWIIFFKIYFGYRYKFFTKIK